MYSMRSVLSKGALSVLFAAALVFGGAPSQGIAETDAGGDSQVQSVVEEAEATAQAKEAEDRAEAEAKEAKGRAEARAKDEGALAASEAQTSDGEVSSQQSAPSLASQATILASGTMPNQPDQHWSIDSNYALSITGSGDLSLSYMKGSAPWDLVDGGYRSKITSVSVAPTLTIKYMGVAFEDFTSLTSIDTSTWTFDTGDIGTSGVFLGCTSLQTANVSGLVNAQCTDANSMFEGCSSLTTITGCDTWDTSGLTSLSSMFYGCKALKSISSMGGWDTSNVTKMSDLFLTCTSLESIDLSSFDCSKVEAIGYFFPTNSNPNLASIKLGPKWKFYGLNEASAATYQLGSTKWKNSATGKVIASTDLVKNYSASDAGTYLKASFVLNETNTVAGYVDAYCTDENVHWSLRDSGDFSQMTLGQDTVITMYPDYGYEVKDVKIDGVSKGAISKYTFSNVSASHTLDVTFGQKSGVASYLITASHSSGNGYIYPRSGRIAYCPGSTKMISFVPLSGSKVKSVVVDGVEQGAISDYTFTGLQADHTVSVSFESGGYGGYSISSSAQSGGTITPWGSTNTTSGTSRKYLITPFTGSAIKDVLVDGNSVGAVSSYTFTNVGETHTIVAEFSAASTSNSISMHRLYNPNSGEHFFTASTSERDNLAKVGWKYEGVAWTAPTTSNTPVYRLYNANGGEHHYTTDAAERDGLVKVGWKYEDIGWYSSDAQTTPLHRLYNPNAFANNHHYTTDTKERDWLVSLGWRYEGIGWYGV